MTVMAKRSDEGELKSPEGTHQAVCYAVWDIGFQKVSYNGTDKSVHKTVIAWEINETINLPGNEYHGKRYVVFERYTLSLSEKANLYKLLVAWRGQKFTEAELKGFDLERLVGANCMIGLEHNEGYVNVISVMKMPKGMEKMVPENTAAVTEGIQKAIDNQFVIEKEEPAGASQAAHSGPAAEQAIMDPKVEPKCAECGKPLVGPSEIAAGVCPSCDLPF